MLIKNTVHGIVTRCKKSLCWPDSQALTLILLYNSKYIHCQGHFLSSLTPCESLKVLTSHIHQSVQQPFILERFVPPVLTKKTIRGTKGYMPRSIDCSQKYFQSYESWKDKKTKPWQICTTTSFKQRRQQSLSLEGETIKKLMND